MDDHEARPELRVYVAFIVIIVAIGAVALALFGGGTSAILSDVSGTV